MAEFHFLRPWWLVALPLGLWLIATLLSAKRARGGGWNALVDAPLRAHVLAAPKALRESRWPLIAALAACTLAVLALAGPTWERLPVPAFRSSEALVVAFDLSRSMDAGDVAPSRLERAKLKLLDLLERRDAGQTALVVFSTHGYTVTPLTTDTRTIASLTNALASDLMPAQGSSIAAGLASAARLLRQSETPTGDVLLITDSEVVSEDLAAARELNLRGHRVNVLAVGTADGAPIPAATGGFMSDASGRVVLPQLDARALRDLAAAGGGRFTTLTADDTDLDTLFPPRGPLGSRTVMQGAASGDDRQAEVWRDRGPWLAVAVLPLLALGFRRGWIASVALVLLLPAPRAQAFEWSDLWRRPDQRAAEAFESRPEQAATLFEDREWRAAAQYRAGQFDESAKSLADVDTAEAHYNRGNALAKSGSLEPAIAAYDRALELEPEHADALYNRDVVAKLLEEQENEQRSEEQQGEQPQESEGQNDFEGSSEGAGQSDKPSDQPSDQSGGQGQEPTQDEGSASPENGEPGDSGERADDQLGPGEQQQSQNESGEDGDEGADGEESADAPASAEELEQWASDQAAEQWLRRIPQDPGGLMRRKFLYQYQRGAVVDDDGVLMLPAPSDKPW